MIWYDLISWFSWKDAERNIKLSTYFTGEWWLKFWRVQDLPAEAFPTLYFSKTLVFKNEQKQKTERTTESFSIVHGDYCMNDTCNPDRELKRLKCEQFLIAGENMRLNDI